MQLDKKRDSARLAVSNGHPTMMAVVTTGNGGFDKLSSYIIDVLRSPDILAVQEVADITELEALADQIELDEGEDEFRMVLAIPGGAGIRNATPAYGRPERVQ